jgi:hypothetical protein
MNTEGTEPQSLQISSEKLFALFRGLYGGSGGYEDDEHPLPPGPWDPVIRVAFERVSVFGPSPEPWRRRVSVFGSHPEPWKEVLASILARHPEIWDAIGGGHSLGDEAALNPQPLPPRFAFLTAVAQAVINRAELLQEIVDASQFEGEGGSALINGGRLPGVKVVSQGGDEERGALINGKPMPHAKVASQLEGDDGSNGVHELPRAKVDSQSGGEERGIIIVSGYITRFVDDFCGTGFRLKYPFPGPRPHWFAEELNGLDLVVLGMQFDQSAKEAYSPDLRDAFSAASFRFGEAGLSKMDSMSQARRRNVSTPLPVA